LLVLAKRAQTVLFSPDLPLKKLRSEARQDEKNNVLRRENGLIKRIF
jgi:hypothetical protein